MFCMYRLRGVQLENSMAVVHWLNLSLGNGHIVILIYELIIAVISWSARSFKRKLVSQEEILVFALTILHHSLNVEGGGG